MLSEWQGLVFLFMRLPQDVSSACLFWCAGSVRILSNGKCLKMLGEMHELQCSQKSSER